MRIFLVGFMGAGKSTVGRALARQLNWDFTDLDHRIERIAGETIPSLFNKYGETGFRQREYAALNVLVSIPRAVISTGGGTFVKPENRELIKKSGTTVWLDPDFAVLWRRLTRSNRERPLLGSQEATLALWQERKVAYQEADLHVQLAAEQQPEQVATEIIGQLAELPCVF